MNSQFIFDEDQKTIATETIFLFSDESEYSTHNSTLDHYLESKYPDSYNALNQLGASQLEQKSIIRTATVPYPPTPIASLISDDNEQHILVLLIGNPAQ